MTVHVRVILDNYLSVWATTTIAVAAFIIGAETLLLFAALMKPRQLRQVMYSVALLAANVCIIAVAAATS